MALIILGILVLVAGFALQKSNIVAKYKSTSMI